MTIRSLAAILATTIALTGCQAMMYGTAADLSKVNIGMDKAQVVAAIGAPTAATTDAAKHEERLLYTKMAQVAGWAPHTYEVALVDGKVVRYGKLN